MKLKTLKNLSANNNITLFCFAKSHLPSLDEVNDLAFSFLKAHKNDKQKAENKILVLNFYANPSLNSEIHFDIQDLFFKEQAENIHSFSCSESKTNIISLYTTPFIFKFTPNKEQTIHFLQELLTFKKNFSEILLILPDSLLKNFQNIIPSAEVVVFFSKTQNESESILLSCSNIIPKIPSEKIWFSKTTIPKNLKISFKTTIPYFNDFHFNENTAKTLLQLKEIHILQKNKPEGVKAFFFQFFPILLLLAFFIPLFIPTKIEPKPSFIRNTSYERANLPKSPYFDYTFDGSESLNRISRYAIGRFHAKVSNSQMINEYMAEVLEKNKITKDFRKKENQIFPDSLINLRFYPFEKEYKKQNYADSVFYAYRYFTSIIADSISYFTEFYHPEATPAFRKHLGIDIAAKQGTRILAPFAAKAWTFEDERGGTVIGLIHKNLVILFMHCDKLLYLNGQNVLAKDPIATVGSTGFSTGPHVHIVTGIVSKKGPKKLGNINYAIIDPIRWYSEFYSKEN